VPDDKHRVETFESHRAHLTGLAYRMLGSVSEAQDAVQEAYLRWHQVDRDRIGNARAFLAKIVTRIGLDEMKSARARRETYVGPWLPEPVLDEAGVAVEAASEYAHDLSVGLLLALERPSPLERAAFLLHDVFDVGFPEIAELLERSEPTCRQLAARGRTHVRAARPRFPMPADGGLAIARAFAAALQRGDISALARVLAEDAVLHSDGGGKKIAALNVIVGRDRMLRLAAGIIRKYPEPTVVGVHITRINGMPGFVTAFSDGSLQTTALEIERGSIAAIYVVRNPEKLRHLAATIPDERPSWDEG